MQDAHFVHLDKLFPGRVAILAGKPEKEQLRAALREFDYILTNAEWLAGSPELRIEVQTFVLDQVLGRNPRGPSLVFAIDEFHFSTDWGKSFRVAFGALGEIVAAQHGAFPLTVRA